MGGMDRLQVTPEWLGILDVEQRFPSAIEKALAVAPAAWPSSYGPGCAGSTCATPLASKRDTNAGGCHARDT
jgi:hypothetical protein